MASATKNYKKMDGKYTIVGLDLDTTGRRLIDEVVHIAAYAPTDEFSQYIMPLMNLNPGARARHQIRVITVGFFRMLKSMVDYKVIKTKTEIATLMEFLNWCEKLNGNNNGVIFVYHEQMKFVPYMMIEIMKKYNLSERFGKIAKGFVNGYDLLDEDNAKALKFLSLTENLKLQKQTLGIKDEVKESDEQQEQRHNHNHDDSEMEGNASRRAMLSYEICKYLSYNREMKELDDKSLHEQMNEFIRAKALPLEAEIDELLVKEESLTRQAAMREIFIGYFSSTRYHRRRAVTFRRELADANHDKDSLQEIWNAQKREGFENLVKSLESVKEEDREEFVDILESFFDEEKKPAKPPMSNNNNNAGTNGGQNGNSNNGGRNNNKGQGMGRRRSTRHIQNSNGKENRGQRNDSRRRNNNSTRPQRNNSKRRYFGNGNVGHEMSHKMCKDQNCHEGQSQASN